MCLRTMYVAVCKHCNRPPHKRIPQYAGQRDASQTIQKILEPCGEYDQVTKQCKSGLISVTHPIRLNFEDICENENRVAWAAANPATANSILTAFAHLLQRYPACPCDCDGHRLADQMQPGDF